MKWLLSLTGISPYMILAVIAVGAGLFFFGRYEGGSDQREADAVALKDAIQEARKLEQASAGITARASEKLTANIEAIATTTNTLILEIPKYVSPKAAARCVVPRGFVSLYNESASGVPSIPLAAQQSNDDASDVALDRTASILAVNNGTCREIREELIGWKSWYRDQSALWAKH